MLLVILAILIPPLAMGLYDGITNRFWISLLLTLLFYVPGLIYTLVVILGGK
ncbi:MAG: YqaE/Pmp3 family membrane protein [Bacteroidota bacterium]